MLIDDQLADVRAVSQIDIQDQARNAIALMVCRPSGKHDEKVGIGLFIFGPSDHGAKEHQAIQVELRSQSLTCLSNRTVEGHG